MRYSIAALFLVLGLAACQRNSSADQANAQIVEAAEAAAQAAQAAADAADTASQNAEAAAKAAETAGSTAEAAAAPAPTQAAATPAATGGTEGQAASVPAGGDGQNAAAEGDEAQNAAPEDGGDSPQAAAGGGEAAAGDAAGAASGESEAAGDAAAGEALFTGKLGCYGCHGRGGGGGMGPSLADKTWIYGGDAASISETLHNGRPGGMPAFGGQATEQEINDVIAYVQSLGGAPAGGGQAAEGTEGQAASVPAGGDGQNAAAEGDEAQNAAPEDGGDSPQAGGDAHAATGTDEQVAAAQNGPIEGAQPPDNTPVTGNQAGGQTVDYETDDVGLGEGYTHPNGLGSDWADDGQAAPVEGAPSGGESAPTEGGDDQSAAPAEGQAASVPAGGDGQNAAAEGDEAQNAAPEDGGDSPQATNAAAGGAAAGGETAGDAAAGEALFTGKLGCYGCHGRGGGGGMGPSLADKTWIYGGDYASISETLHNGRPGGMPAFGGQATEQEINDVIAYVQSLGGAPAGGGGAAAPAEGGDAHAATGTDEQVAAAQDGPITGSQPPDNTPVSGNQAGGSSLDYDTADVGRGTGYTHPNGIGADWADDGTAEPVEGPPAPGEEVQSNDAQNAAPEDGGDAHAATGTDEQVAAAQSGPITGSQPPDNTPVTGEQAGGSSLDYETAKVGQGEGYTHPNGLGSDWADDGQAAPVEGTPAEGNDDQSAAPAEGESASVPAGGDGQNAAAEGDEAQNAAPEDGGDSNQAAAAPAQGQTAAIEGSQPPDNTPVTTAASSSLDYATAGVGTGEGYTHPNGIGADWADDGQAEPVEGPPAPGEEAQGDEAQNAAPEDGGDSPQAETTPAAPITGSRPPDNTPVTGEQGGGTSLDYGTANVGQGEGYTHPNGLGSDWASSN